MKTQFIVTIDGEWLTNGKPTTPAIIEKYLRSAVKEEFQHVADKIIVKRVKEQLTIINTASQN